MARLTYAAIVSQDGYVADESGRFDWAEPDEDVHGRMHEVMVAWETGDSDLEQPEYIRDFARIWQAADRIVYSRTLETGPTARTRIEREFNPEAIRWMKANLEKDILIAGPTLAANAIEAGLVDDYHLFVAPTAVGGGLRFLPGGCRLDLVLVDEHRFANGMVHLRYAASAG